MRFSSRYLFILILISGMTGAGFVLRSDAYFLIKKNFTIFSEVYENVSSIYINEVDPEQLIRSGINAMLDELDPYTVLIDESESHQMDIVTTGQYAGVGLEIGARGGQLVVIAPIEGYSAEKRGIRTGDVIMEVDGIDVSQMSPEDIQSLLRGEPGSKVILTIHRFGIEDNLDFELTRETIDVKNISYYGLLEEEPRIGYVLLQRFTQNAAEEVRSAILEMEEEGSMEGLVLDLRNNPGGLLDEAVKLIDIFIPAGQKVVWTEGRMSRANQVYETSEDPVFKNKPLIILQNHGSASASEIVSGSLQDLDRAVIIGERSFGKGLVQIIQPLSYNTALKITTSKYFTASGRSIQSTPFVTGEDVGSTDQVHDSLRNRFTTKSGRTVYEGIGIEPDILKENRQQSMLEIALLQNSHYFFFANEYTSEHEHFDQHNDRDMLFNEFMQYLDDNEFQYTTRAERHLQRFGESLDEFLNEESIRPIQEMEELIAIEKEKVKEKYSEYIKRELYLELVSRYEGRTGRMQKSLINDELTLEAIDVLKDNSRYASIINP